MLPITLRKGNIGESDIDQIQTTVNEHWGKGKGRKHISKVLCLKWQWHQPNGQLKDMACREILLTLKRKGLITLPPPLHNANNHKRNKNIPKISVDQTPLQEDLCQLPPVKVKMVRGTDVEPLHNSLVHHYHFLGSRYCGNVILSNWINSWKDPYLGFDFVGYNLGFLA